MLQTLFWLCTDLAIIVTKSIFKKNLRDDTIILHTILEWKSKRKEKDGLK